MVTEGEVFLHAHFSMKGANTGYWKKDIHTWLGFVLHWLSSLFSPNVYEFSQFTECELEAVCAW